MANRLRQTVQSIQEGTPAEKLGLKPGVVSDPVGVARVAAEMLPGSGFVTGVQKGGTEGGIDFLAELLGIAGGIGGAVAGPPGIAGGYMLGKGGVKGLRSLLKPEEVSENIYKKPVYHSTRKAKEIEDADKIYFVSKNNDADIGFHVATSPLSANQRIILNKSRQDELKNIAEYEKRDPGVAKALKGALDERYTNQSNLLLKLKDNINPVRVPDVSNFKNPLNWAETLAVSKKDFPDNFHLTQTIAPSYGVDPLIINYKGDELIVSPKYLQDIMDNEGKINKEYMEDLVKLVYKGKDKVLSKKDKFDPQSSVQDRRKWFEQLKEVNKKHGYDSFIYKNEYEGFDSRSARFDPKTGETEVIKDRPEKPEDSLMLMYPNQVKYATAAEFNPNKEQLSKKQGGSVVERNPYANYQPKAI